MEIKILGPGCANCHKLEQLTVDALAELGIDADVRLVTDRNEISKWVMMTPGLLINGKLFSQGKIPSPSTLKRWFQEAAAQI
ncbi:thioredoxin family protein [candidate division KSB1 bacterium]|nr:thioredoxin family protein [candidate division KSB1 bacterium]